MKKFAILSIVLASVLGITGCGNSDAQTARKAAKILDEKLPMKRTSTIRLSSARAEGSTIVVVEYLTNLSSADFDADYQEKYLRTSRETLKNNYCNERDWVGTLTQLQLPVKLETESADSWRVGSVTVSPEDC